jgi:hypothetical protein
MTIHHRDSAVPGEYEPIEPTKVWLARLDSAVYSVFADKATARQFARESAYTYIEEVTFYPMGAECPVEAP